MIALAALLAAQASAPSAPPPPVLRREQAMARLVIPDQIAPAILPYLRCRLDSIGQPVYSGTGGPRVQSSVPVGADCSSARTEAARRAEQMLVEQRRGDAAERRAFIERALVDVDTFVSNAQPAMAPAQEKPNAED